METMHKCCALLSTCQRAKAKSNCELSAETNGLRSGVSLNRHYLDLYPSRRTMLGVTPCVCVCVCVLREYCMVISAGLQLLKRSGSVYCVLSPRCVHAGVSVLVRHSGFLPVLQPKYAAQCQVLVILLSTRRLVRLITTM